MRIILFLVSFWTFISCSSNSDLDAIRNEILEMHHAQRDYHFSKDSIAFAQQLSDNFLSVNKGKITKPSQKETISRYNNYFANVSFIKWDDEEQPIIRISSDGKMAYTVVDKIVEVTYKDSIGNSLSGETHFAWTAIYVKSNNEWKIDCVTSTNRPIKQ